MALGEDTALGSLVAVGPWNLYHEGTGQHYSSHSSQSFCLQAFGLCMPCSLQGQGERERTPAVKAHIPEGSQIQLRRILHHTPGQVAKTAGVYLLRILKPERPSSRVCGVGSSRLAASYNCAVCSHGNKEKNLAGVSSYSDMDLLQSGSDL